MDFVRSHAQRGTVFGDESVRRAAGVFNKSTFDITGTRDLAASIKESLDALAAAPAKLMPTTVLFVEIPTNPDMKVPDILVLAKICSNYKK
jgi:cystathionine beta-lyase/cystathionine gamma-synthase